MLVTFKTSIDTATVNLNEKKLFILYVCYVMLSVKIRMCVNVLKEKKFGGQTKIDSGSWQRSMWP